MAEIKNSFLASKMNKDLDDRLIPSNEYKDALNIAVSNSEDSDVGALENILQNTNIYPISSETNIGNDNGKIIGKIANPANDEIYLFYTNYKDISTDKLSNHQASSFGANTTSVIIRYNPVLPSGESSQLVIGRFLNFSETSPIHGINIVEDFLFWTDDRNQPRKINIRRAAANRLHYASEDDVSVAKFAPYTPIDLYKNYSGTYKTTMKDATSELLPDETTANPDYNPLYAGDSNYLEDKFARFSYRFKYEDGEYSIMAPFTQIAFIPKQDGSFLAGDETLAFTSTIVAFMENKVDQISLVINLPSAGEDLHADYKIKEIDILYKESDRIAVSVLDTVSVAEVALQSLATNVYEYSYQSRKPVRTLPQNQSTRVYDKTPVRALAQEVSGNRVIYGNFVNKHTAPSHLDYQVTVNQKFSSGLVDNNWSYIEYPEHTVKRNRNYQVGFILSDRYGRQSDVILSSVIDNNSVNGTFGASTFYVPYRPSASSPTTFLADVGNSIKIQLNEAIKSTRSPLSLNNSISTGEPGLYDVDVNPTGWYSYKIVVKQTQQEYYNVYLPGFLQGDLNNGPSTATHSVLIGDNINKVPRDLQEVGPNQTKYRSSEVLFPVVENYHTNTENWNQAFYPENNKFDVTTVAPFADLNSLGGTAHGAIFENTEDPLIMRIGDNNGGLGADNQHMVPMLSIAETTPFISNIDIYYETSTSGLISELNNKVITDVGTPIMGFSTFDYAHNESQDWNGSGTITGDPDSPYITSELIPVDNVNNLLNNTQFVSLSVLDTTGQNRTSQFEMIATGSVANGYRLKLKDVTSQFYYGPDAATKESYSFTMGLRNLDDNTTATLDSPVTSSNVISVTVTAGNAPFVGQTISGAGIPNATVTFVDGSNVTLNVPVANLAQGYVFNFTAPVTTFVRNGALGNSSPTIELITYVTPAFSTMQGLYATIVAYNGTFIVAKRELNIQYVWSTLQPQLFGGFGEFSLSSVGDTSLITINNPSGGQVTLAMAQNGRISIFAGAFDFLSTFNLKVTVTDAGGLTTEATIVFDEVVPGAFTNAFSTAFDI